MLVRRYFDVLTLFQRPYNVVIMSCVGWDKARKNLAVLDIYKYDTRSITIFYLDGDHGMFIPPKPTTSTTPFGEIKTKF